MRCKDSGRRRTSGDLCGDREMSADDSTAILAAEVDVADARHLLRCLAPLSRRVLVAITPEAVAELLRREAFAAAAVAVELTLRGRPLLACLTRLPCPGHTVAIGPAGVPTLERLARRAGAQAYLIRPVSADLLTLALTGHRPHSGALGGLVGLIRKRQ